MKSKTLALISILIVTSLACNFSIQPPEVTTIPPVTTTIGESYPSSSGINKLTLEMGGGTLQIKEGNGKLVEGEITTNISDLKPSVSKTDDGITISQKTPINSVNFPKGDLQNEWNLSIGTQQPVSLDINAGAYKSEIEFGKIPLTNLEISDGASQSKITFNQVNTQKMKSFIYKTGASQVDLVNLANANFENMTFESGAGAYTLDFSGDLQRDAQVTIKSGLSNLKILIPSESNTTITISGGVTNVSLKGTFTVNGSRYKTNGSDSPELKINIDLGVGNLELISVDENSL